MAGTEDVPVQGPLAATYNIEGDDDLDAGGDDESENDARMMMCCRGPLWACANIWN